MNNNVQEVKGEKQDYEVEYESFWKKIVENEDGTMNKEQIMRELADYSIVMDNCKKAYMKMTEQNISKPLTYFSEVLEVFHERYVSKAELKDELTDIIRMCMDYDELIAFLTDSFNSKKSKRSEKKSKSMKA